MNILSRRRELGLLQKDLSKVTGINQSTISKYENGKLQIRREAMGKIAKALEVDVQTLFFSEEN